MKLRKYICYSAVLLGSLFLLNISWLRWGNLIIDTFSDPWVAYKISQGKVLYRDIYYLFGLLPPYFLSFLYSTFGTNLNCLVFTGIFILLVSSVLIYRICRFFLSQGFSTLVVLNFLFVFALGSYSHSAIFNFILPYNLASTFWLMFTLLGLYFAIKFIMKDNIKNLLFWAISIYLSFLSRLSMTLIIWLGSIFMFMIYGYLKKKKKLSLFAWGVLPFLLAGLTYFIFLYCNDAFAGFKDSSLRAINLSGRSNWETFINGVSNFSFNLPLVFKSFLSQAAAISLIYLFCWLLASLKIRFKLGISNLLIHSLSGLAAIVAGVWLLNYHFYFYNFRLMPLLLILLALIYFFKAFFNKSTDGRKDFALFFLASISLILLVRIILRVSPHRYGFYLAVPGLICYYVFFVETIPLVWKKIFKVSQGGKRYYLTALTILFVLLAIPFIRVNFRAYGAKNCLAISERGKFRSFCDIQAKRFWQAVHYLSNSTPRDSKVVVFPEGIGINFFSLRDNPLRYFNFVPTLTAKIGQAKIIRQMEDKGVDYVVVLQRETSEHGYPAFGKDYCQQLYSWIINNYELRKQFGPYPFSSKEFGIAIFKRK